MPELDKRPHLEFFPKNVTEPQVKDSGMAFVLISLLAAYFTGRDIYLPLAIGPLLLNMTWPPIYRYPAILWLGLSTLLGTVVSKILLSVVFYGLVMPIGLLRCAFGADSLRLKQWKRDRSSVFSVRDHTFTARDIEKPY